MCGEEESASRWGCRLSRCHAGQMPRTCSGAELPAFSSCLGPALRPTPAWRRHTLGHQVTPHPQGSHGSAPEDDRVNGGACSFSGSDEGPWTAPRLWAARSCPPVLPPRRQTLACLLCAFPSVGTHFLSASAHDENWLFNRNDKTLAEIWM